MIIDLRDYTLKPNTRDQFIERCETLLFPEQKRLGATILGTFRDELKGQRIAGRVKGGKLKPYETHAEIFDWINAFSSSQKKHDAINLFKNLDKHMLSVNAGLLTKKG